MKKVLIILLALVINICGVAQSWQYVGSPYINPGNVAPARVQMFQHPSNGDVFMGYLNGYNYLRVERFDGSVWSNVFEESNPHTYYIEGLDFEVNEDGDIFTLLSYHSGSSYRYIYMMRHSNGVWAPEGDTVVTSNGGMALDLEIAPDGTLYFTHKNDFYKFNSISQTWEVLPQPNSGNLISLNEGNMIVTNSGFTVAVTSTYNTSSPPYVHYHEKIMSWDGSVWSYPYDSIAVEFSQRLELDMVNGVPYITHSEGVPRGRRFIKKNVAGVWTDVGDTSQLENGNIFMTATQNGDIYVTTTASNGLVYQLNGTNYVQLDSVRMAYDGSAFNYYPNAIYFDVNPGIDKVQFFTLDLYPSGGNARYSIFQYDEVSEVLQNDFGNLDLSIFPNPCPSGQIYFNSEVDGSAYLTDQLGRVIDNFQVFGGSNMLDVSELENGSYLLVIRNGETVQIARFLITH